jgi:hypothetical protein
VLRRVNEAVIQAEKNNNDDENNDKNSGSGDQENKQIEKENSMEQLEIENKGTLILDATCAPADIQYPTDIRILNDAREKLEIIVDVLHATDKGQKKRPRTHRKKAHKAYIAFTKQRKPKPSQIRKMRGKLLRYTRRILGFIGKLAENHGLESLSKRQYKDLLVIQEIYRQQLEMYEQSNWRIADRIVSISQPHVRPIIRGKASADTEFGAKVAISVENGFTRCEVLSWDAFNEGITLIESAEKYKARTGYYPAAILADSIYRNRENRAFCKKEHIRLSGPKLGRKTEKIIKQEQKQAYIDNCDRNEVEGKFGEAKRKYTLGRIMAKLPETSASTIMLNILVMNLEKRLRLLLREFWYWLNLKSFSEKTV